MQTQITMQNTITDEEHRREQMEELAIANRAMDVGVSVQSFKNRKAVKEASDDFFEKYGDLIPTPGHVYLQGQILGGACNIVEFEESALFVLKHSYVFFDKKGELIEDEKYERILKRIREYNPEWLESFKLHHKLELERIERVRKGKPIRPSQ